jgi:hypothetical protein
MAIAKVNIAEVGSNVLRERAADVPVRLMKSDQLKGFVRIMLAAMKDAPGVGSRRRNLAFPLRIIVFGDTETNAQCARSVTSGGSRSGGPGFAARGAMPDRPQMDSALFLGCKVGTVGYPSQSCRTVSAGEGRRISHGDLAIPIRAVPCPAKISLSPKVNLPGVWVSRRFARWPLESPFAGQKCQLPYTTLDTLKGNWTTKRSQFELLMGPRQGEA